MTHEFISDDGSIIPSKRCKRCGERKVMLAFPYRPEKGTRSAHYENVCKGCKNEQDRERDLRKKIAAEKPPKKKPYQRDDAPDELNAIARAWRGPTTGVLQVRI